MEQLLGDLFAPLNAMSLPVAAARLTLAALLGALLGLERELTAHPAGLRTHMLIALAAALFTVIAMELTHLRPGDEASLQVDPLRLIEAVTAGVAFLAAGSIIVSGGSVRGVTTGASMWLAGAIGLSAGSGRGTLAVVAALMGLAILWLIRLATEKRAGPAATKPGAGGPRAGGSGGDMGGSGGRQPPEAPRDAKDPPFR